MGGNRESEDIAEWVRVFFSVMGVSGAEDPRHWAPLEDEEKMEFSRTASALLEEQLGGAGNAKNIANRNPIWPYGSREEDVLPSAAGEINGEISQDSSELCGIWKRTNLRGRAKALSSIMFNGWELEMLFYL